MIQGYVNQPVVLVASFQPSRAGLATVGYTVYSGTGAVIRARTTENVFEVIPESGIYQVQTTFGSVFTGVVVWDTGQDPDGVGAARLRRAVEEIAISQTANDVAMLSTQVSDVKDAVTALFDENVIKVADSVRPNQITIKRKRSQDVDWSMPYSQGILPVRRLPGDLRVGGPL